MGCQYSCLRSQKKTGGEAFHGDKRSKSHNDVDSEVILSPLNGLVSQWPSQTTPLGVSLPFLEDLAECVESVDDSLSTQDVVALLIDPLVVELRQLLIAGHNKEEEDGQSFCDLWSKLHVASRSHDHILPSSTPLLRTDTASALSWCDHTQGQSRAAATAGLIDGALPPVTSLPSSALLLQSFHIRFRPALSWASPSAATVATAAAAAGDKSSRENPPHHILRNHMRRPRNISAQPQSANVVVAHAWGDSFVSLVHSVKHYTDNEMRCYPSSASKCNAAVDASRGDPYFWIDFLCSDSAAVMAEESKQRPRSEPAMTTKTMTGECSLLPLTKQHNGRLDAVIRQVRHVCLVARSWNFDTSLAFRDEHCLQAVLSSGLCGCRFAVSLGDSNRMNVLAASLKNDFAAFANWGSCLSNDTHISKIASRLTIPDIESVQNSECRQSRAEEVMVCLQYLPAGLSFNVNAPDLKEVASTPEQRCSSFVQFVIRDTLTHWLQTVGPKSLEIKRYMSVSVSDAASLAALTNEYNEAVKLMESLVDKRGEDGAEEEAFVDAATARERVIGLRKVECMLRRVFEGRRSIYCRNNNYCDGAILTNNTVTEFSSSQVFWADESVHSLCVALWNILEAQAAATAMGSGSGSDSCNDGDVNGSASDSCNDGDVNAFAALIASKSSTDQHTQDSHADLEAHKLFISGLTDNKGLLFEALEMLGHAAFSLEHLFGFIHPKTLDINSDRALLLEKKCDLIGSQTLMMSVLDGAIKSSGPLNNGTVQAALALTRFYTRLDKSSEAINILTDLIRLQDQAAGGLGSFSLNTAVTLNALAKLYRLQADQQLPLTYRNQSIRSLPTSLEQMLKQAEVLYRRVLKIMLLVLGPKHADTLISLNNLAVLLIRIATERTKRERQHQQQQQHATAAVAANAATMGGDDGARIETAKLPASFASDADDEPSASTIAEAMDLFSRILYVCDSDPSISIATPATSAADEEVTEMAPFNKTALAGASSEPDHIGSANFHPGLAPVPAKRNRQRSLVLAAAFNLGVLHKRNKDYPAAAQCFKLAYSCSVYALGAGHKDTIDARAKLEEVSRRSNRVK